MAHLFFPLVLTSSCQSYYPRVVTISWHHCSSSNNNATTTAVWHILRQWIMSL